ncbi:MAG: ABC transporter permease [Actinomycetota bacterium]
MSPLWRWVTLRHLFHGGGRTLLTLLGVALGVAVFVSIRLANHSAMASFAETVDTVAGKANLQIVSDSGGFDERFYPKLRDVPGVEATAPVVQAYALLQSAGGSKQRVFDKAQENPSNDTLLVLGIDLLSEAPFARFEEPEERDERSALQFMADPTSVAITRTLANRHQLKVGSPLPLLVAGREVTLTVRWVLESQALQQAMGGAVVLTDIANAQEAFQRYGKLDRIDLVVDPDRKEAVKEALQSLLPKGVRVAQPQGRTEQVENMVAAFGLNLTALAFIALFVSMFLIFNSVSLSVLRRRREIGILRALGVTRKQMVTLFLGEALFLGIVGSLVGLGLGTLMAQGSLKAVARTITTLYLMVHAEHVYFDPWSYAMGFALGVGMSVLSALAPAIEASRTQPSLTVRQGTFVEAQQPPIGRLTAIGIGMVGLSALIALWTIGARRPEGGFVSATLLLVGFSLLAPGFSLLCVRLTGGLVRKLGGIEGAMGAAYLREAIARTSMVVAALMVAVGMTVGLSIMVGSFRKTVNVWVDQTLRGDLYVEPVGRTVTGSATRLPPKLVDRVRGLPGVAAVDTYRSIQISYGDRLAYLIGIDFAVQRDHGQMQFLQGESRAVFDAALQRDQVIVTESFAFRNRLGVGDTVRLDTPTGEASLTIAGVFYDYATDAGAILIDYHVYQRLWNDDRTENMAIYTEPGASVDEVRSALIQAAGPELILFVTPNQSLRSRVMQVFDQTFQITYALQAIAILVAVLGVVTTLTGLILQRGREIGVLRAVGALRGQVRKMVLVESGLIGLIGALMGCVCGVALSVLLTYVINKQFFGWSIQMTIDPWLFVQATALMVGTAVVAGLVPARLAGTRVAAGAMRVD